MEICKKIEEDISAYLDNELSSFEKDNIEKHVSICPECSEKLEKFKKLWQDLDDNKSNNDSSLSITKFYNNTLPSYLIKKTNYVSPNIIKIGRAHV